MPEEFTQRIRIMRLHQTVQLVGLIISMMSAAIFLGCLIEKGTILISAAWCLTICFLVSTTALIWSHRYMSSRSEHLPVYRIPISCCSVESVAETMGAGEIMPDAYVSFTSSNGIKIRMLILYRKSFHGKELTNQRKRANKQINKLFPIPSEEPYFKAVARLRINLVVCDRYSDELAAWINRRPEQLMQRNESILSAAITLEEGCLLIPAIMSKHMDLKQLKKYEIATNVLVDNLAS